MAYNPLTKLLLKFNEGSATDTSASALSVAFTGSASSSSDDGMFSTNSMLTGDPFGSETVGSATVASPEALFSNSGTEARRFDFWFKPEGFPASAYSTLFKATWDDGTSLDIVINVFGNFYVESGPSPELPGGGGLYSGSFYPTTGEWHHARLYIENNYWCLGINGSQVDSATGALSFWPGTGTNTVTEFVVGDYGEASSNLSFRGYIDCFEVTEGDDSWTGGSYTVPTAEPESYGGGGNPELFGDGATTLDDLTSYGTDSLPEITGSGESTLDEVVSLGAAPLPEIEGSGDVTLGDVGSEGLGTTLGALSVAGANEVDSIASTGEGSVVSDIIGEGAATLDDFTTNGVGGGKDITTTLMLHCNTGQETLDSSAHALTVTGNGTWGASANSWLNGSAQFQKLSGFGGYFSIPQQGALFADPTTDKIIDFRFRRLGTVGYETIFSVGFSASNYFSLLINDSGELIVECITPDFTLVTTIASGITFSIWRHARVAVVGNALYVCINGAQVYSTTSASALLWPQNNACTGLAIGQMFPPQAWAGLNANIDEFRVQEGFFADHGYAGGNFSLPTYEWFPGQVLGNGSNTVTVESIGEVKEYAENFGQGSNTVSEVYQVCKGRLEYPVNGANTADDVVSYGHVVSGVYISAFGATTVDDMAVSGHTEVLPVVSGQSALTLADITSEGVGGISWSARGANAISVTSEGFGVGPAWHVGSGKNTVANVTSQGTLSGPRTGQGSSATNVTSTGVGKSLIRGDGANTVSASATTSAKLLCSGLAANSVEVSSQGAASAAASGYGQATATTTSAGVATVVCRGYGSGNVSVTSAGVVGAAIAGYATSLCGASSSGAGAVMIQGYGAGYVADVFTMPDYPDDTAHLFVLTRTPRIFATRRNNTMTVRGSA